MLASAVAKGQTKQTNANVHANGEQIRFANNVNAHTHQAAKV